MFQHSHSVIYACQRLLLLNDAWWGVITQYKEASCLIKTFHDAKTLWEKRSSMGRKECSACYMTIDHYYPPKSCNPMAATCFSCLTLGKNFVIASAVMSLVEVYATSSVCSLLCCSRIQWYDISQCFVRWWYFGFLVTVIELWLSAHSLVGGMGVPTGIDGDVNGRRLKRRDRNQIPSFPAWLLA